MTKTLIEFKALGSGTDMADESRWHFLETVEIMAEGCITARVSVPGNSLWFSGHFPGSPVLPGIAQISIVLDVIEKAAGHGVVLKKLYRTKYRRIIMPEESVDVYVLPVGPDADQWRFELIVDKQTACRGRLRARAI